jgi:hypothetical protein
VELLGTITALLSSGKSHSISETHIQKGSRIIWHDPSLFAQTGSGTVEGFYRDGSLKVSVGKRLVLVDRKDVIGYEYIRSVEKISESY